MFEYFTSKTRLMKLNSSNSFGRFTRIALCFALVCTTQLAHAQKKDKKDPPKETPAKDDGKKISELIKKHAVYAGLFTIYQDSTTGSVKLLIKKYQIGKEFIHFSQFVDAPVAAGSFRGNYAGSKVFKIEKYFNRIEFVVQNTSSYFDPSNAISKASEANMPHSVMVSMKIEGTNDDESEFLVNADDLFLQETLEQIKAPNFPGQSPFAFTVGNLDKDKSKINAIRSYPENTDVAVEYVYSKSSVLNGGGRDVTDARNVSMRVYHSLLQMPEEDYLPLIDDPRVGYFTSQVTDMTSLDYANYRDLVHRWKLVKKDPSQAISEPVEPIVWWIENTTPVNLRPIIQSAAEAWNIAFEKAGFRNALVVKIQPDDADWDAGDIRYNVLRWTASPYPPFGGYGPSFVNPRTGEILGADIMFEYRSVIGRLQQEFSWTKPTAEGTESLPIQCTHFGCQAAELGSVNNAFAGMVLEYLDGVEMENSKMIKEFLHYLVLHELGHTLGLNHNMKASQLHSLAKIHDEAFTSKMGLMGSVMDYPSVNVAADRSKQGQYYTTRPGPYDIWAIQFAYQTNRTAEETEALLNRSTEHDLLFGNDADDMRSPGKAIDPRVNIYDLTSDAIDYGIERLKLVDTLAQEMMKKYTQTGTSHHNHFIAFNGMMRQYADVQQTVTRYVGGVYLDRAMIGQPGATTPYIPVPAADQKKAMKALSDYFFAPNAMDFANGLYQYLQSQRRGFNHFGQPEDPKVHEITLNIQREALEHLLSPNTLQRIVDSKLYGNSYELSTMMSELTDAIFKADINGNVNSMRQNLQVEYVRMLIGMVTGESSKEYMYATQSPAVYFLKEIRKMAATGTGDLSSKAHKAHLTTLIDNALEEIK
jgi:hypothetical protein